MGGRGHNRMLISFLLMCTTRFTARATSLLGWGWCKCCELDFCCLPSRVVSAIFPLGGEEKCKSCILVSLLRKDREDRIWRLNCFLELSASGFPLLLVLAHWPVSGSECGPPQDASTAIVRSSFCTSRVFPRHRSKKRKYYYT